MTLAGAAPVAIAARTVAQAKINLFLHVLGRESSGYHTLETLFQRIDLGDEVVVRAGVSGRALDCRGADTGPVERNLAWRAAIAFAEAAGWPSGFAIEIEKRIPVGGGLGGGSADAGAVLRVLNALAPAPLPAPRLLQLAVSLGADVPFLASDAARALAWGRGERLLALPALPARQLDLLLPGTAVATAEAFRWLAASRKGDGPWARGVELSQLEEWRSIAALAGNDFEAPVAANLPRASLPAETRARLADTAAPDGERRIVAMTGSGSTWFVLPGPGEEQVRALVPPGWRVVGTRTAERVAPVERLD